MTASVLAIVHVGDESNQHELCHVPRVGDTLLIYGHLKRPENHTVVVTRVVWDLWGSDAGTTRVDVHTQPAQDTYPVPPGYALIGEDMLRAWGRLDEVRAACAYPTKDPR